MNTISLWKDTAHDSFYPQLNGEITVDAVIIGGGITGLTTALQLTRSNLKVAIVEAWKIGDGATGFSTGNLYAATDKYYHTIENKFNTEITKTIAEARTTAVNFIEKLIADHNFEVEFTKQPWYFYAERDEDIKKIENEADAMLRAGLDVNLVNEIPLPFKIKKAVLQANQARFNPMQYAKVLAQYLSGGNCLIFENTKMISYDLKDPDVNELSTVTCETGKIKAKYIIMATHTPKGFDIVQTMLAPYRSYAIAAKLTEPVYPKGVFWDTHPGYHHATTSHKGTKGEYLVVVGAGHKTGQREDNIQSFKELENYARERYPVASIEYTWSAQNYKPADGVPFIGKSPQSHIYIATGFSADGLTWGTAAGIHIANLIAGTASERWKEAFSPARFTPVASAEKFIMENVNTAKYYIRDYITKQDFEQLSHVEKGRGELVEMNGEKLAVYRNENDELTVLDPVCPHLKCLVHWNEAETTWDCPCHGSRFTKEGRVIEGPAIADLSKKKINE